MVKIVEVDERDEECYEIDPAEFAKNVNLKETDDVILVAAKGKIKLALVEPEDFEKTSSGYGGAATCSRVGESDGVTRGSRHDFAAGNSMDNPYLIKEDEQVLLQMEIVEDRFSLDKSRPEFGADDNNNGNIFQGYKDERRTAVTPYKILVKAGPDELEGVDGVGHDACNHSNKMNSKPGAGDDEEGQFFHGDEDAVDVVSDKLGAKPSEPVDNYGVEVIPDSIVAKCEPVDGHGVKGADEDAYEVIPERKTFEEEDEDNFVIV